MESCNRRDFAARIGRQVRYLRCQEELTQEQLADLAELSPPHICRIETGQKLAGIDTLAKIAAALGVTVDVLIGNCLSIDLEADCPDLHTLLSGCSSRERRILYDIAIASLLSIRENT